MSSQSVYTLANLHDDHRRWQQDQDEWDVDLEHWGRQHKAALADLDSIRKALEEHGVALQSHGTRVREGAARIAEHERSITEYTQRGQGQDLTEELVHWHQAQAESQADDGRLHERLKARQGRVLAAVATLKAELTSPY